jgi:glycine/D-amino acid oxidase-like deaminating enzyme
MSVFGDEFRTDPYWWDGVPPLELGAARASERCDVLVIGSGYTGLSAALQTARGGRHTVVLDAEAAGFGCSTRNGGQISISVKPSFEQLRAKFGSERAYRILREGHDALAWIGSFVADEGIACDFTVCGRFHGAHNGAQFERLARAIGAEPKGLESGAWLISRAEQRSELGTDAYWGGVVYPRYAALDPARFHRGLLARVLEATATVVPHCPVQALRREREGFEVATPQGVVRAREVIVATNGYTGPLTPWLRRRVIPIGSYIIATEPLDEGLIARLMPRNRTVTDSRKVVYYYRASPDRRRILFGGRVSLDEADARRSGRRLHAELVRIFPELARVRISHSWVGTVAYTFDTLAHVGSHEGVRYAMGYCGSGVSMAAYLGMRVGQQLLGRPEGATGFDHLPFPTVPLYTGKPWFLAASLAYYRWRDGLNR